MKILMFELVHSNLNSDGRFKFLLLLIYNRRQPGTVTAHKRGHRRVHRTKAYKSTNFVEI